MRVVFSLLVRVEGAERFCIETGMFHSGNLFDTNEQSAKYTSLWMSIPPQQFKTLTFEANFTDLFMSQNGGVGEVSFTRHGVTHRMAMPPPCRFYVRVGSNAIPFTNFVLQVNGFEIFNQ